MEQTKTKKMAETGHKDYILDEPRKAMVLAAENIAKVPGLGEYLKNPEIRTGIILFVEFKVIDSHLMQKTAKYHHDCEMIMEIIVALSDNGDVIGEIDNIPRKDEGVLAFLLDFISPGAEARQKENVLTFLKRLDEQKVREIANIVSIAPTGKILVYRRPPGFKDVYQWLNTKEKEITRKIIPIDS
jgi:hypothetical protein